MLTQFKMALTNECNVCRKILNEAEKKASAKEQMPALCEYHLNELKTKLTLDEYNSINWHFIGHLQTNKVKYLVDRFHFIHSVDRENLIVEINKKIKSNIKIFLEINTGEEKSKSGSNEDALINNINLINKLNIERKKTTSPLS